MNKTGTTVFILPSVPFPSDRIFVLMNGLDDLGDHIKLVKLRHEIHASCPSLELIDQFDSYFHSSSGTFFTRRFNSSARLIWNENAGHFMVQEVYVPGTHERQYSDKDRFA